MSLTRNHLKNQFKNSQHNGFVCPGILLGLCCSLLGNQSAEAASFNFTKIADNQNSLLTGYKDWTGAINDQGTVAFYAGSGFGNGGIFTGTGKGQEITTVFNHDILAEFYPNPYPPNVPPANYFIRPSVDINDQNTVAFTGGAFFLGGYDSRQGIFIADKNKIKTVTEFSPSGRLEGRGLMNLDLNNQNSIMTLIGGAGAFIAPYSTITLYNNINQSNPSSTLIAQGTYDNYFKGGIGDISSVSLNNQGTVAFSARYQDLSAPNPENRLFISQGNSLTSITTDVNLNTNIALNDLDELIFQSSDFNSEPGIFSLKNGTITNLVNSQGLFSSFESIDINNQGTLAFSAILDTGEKGIFSGADTVKDKVIGVGDFLFGSTITELNFFGDKGLNNKGQIAFYAELADGTKGIFRADPSSSSPKPVPEPTSIFSLLALGVWGLSSRRQSR